MNGDPPPDPYAPDGRPPTLDVTSEERSREGVPLEYATPSQPPRDWDGRVLARGIVGIVLALATMVVLAAAWFTYRRSPVLTAAGGVQVVLAAALLVAGLPAATWWFHRRGKTGFAAGVLVGLGIGGLLFGWCASQAMR